MSGRVAYGCSNRSTKGFLMKVFPRDPVIRAIWAEKVNREGWTPTNYSRLCETHFESDQWEKTRVDGSRKLKWNAVPTLFAHVKINKQKRKSPTKRGSPIKKRKLLRTRHTSVPDQQRMECEDTESLPSTEHQSSHISPSLQVCKSYHCQKYGNPEPGTELQNIKQEPDYETATNMETQSLIPSEELKHEPDYESQNMQNEEEANEEEESDTSPVMKRSSTCSPALSSLDNIFLHCETCQLKYEGGCPEHGLVIYLGNAEEGQGEGYGQDSSPHVQVVDNKDRQVLGREKVEQSKVYEAHSDDVGTLPNGGCSTESDEMFSVCEMNTELCVAGTNCGLKSNVEMNTELCVAGTSCGLKSNVEMNTQLCVAGTSCGLQSNVEMNTELCVAGTSCGEQSNVKIKAGHHIHNSEKPFSCDVCGVGFVESRALKTHIRIHTGEKPYKCDVCGTGFAEQGILNLHKRTHTGEKHYKCDVCGLGFNRQASLNKHKRTHTVEKSYKCDVCGTWFTEQNNLNRHKRTHTEETPSATKEILSGKHKISFTKHNIIPVYSTRRGNCKLCYQTDKVPRRIQTKCDKCDTYLCFTTTRNCLLKYHETQ